ncbi:PPE domain-containing protein [Nocardia lasii]|uniref:PPE domain-containing protein n=1 Tax=Nocardia lasii TaxID=1616107 RepID=A0ABW1K1W1_9NOCA
MGWSWQETVGLIPIAGTYLAGGIGGHRESHEAATERGRLGDGASNQWSPDRSIINNEYQRLGADFTGTVAGRVVEPEGFGSWPHWKIYAYLNGAEGEPGVSAADINAGADAWRRLTTTVDDLVTTYDATISRVIGEMWSGQAANAAVDGVREYATQAKQLPVAFQLVANGIDLMEGYLAQAKMAIPEPEELNTWDHLAAMIPGNGLLKGDRHQYNEAEAAAQQIMTTLYSPGSVQVDGQTPVLPVAKNTFGGLGDGDPNGGSPGTNPQGNGGSPGAPTNPATTTDPTATNPAAGEPESVDPSAQNPADTDPDTDTDTDDTTPSATTPETTPTTPAGTPTGGAPGSGAPGTGGPGSGSPSGGAPGAGAPGAGSPVAGAVQPGTPGAGVAGGAGNSAAAARGANSGMRGMPGMMGGGGGRGQGGDDETERKTPDYLIHERESELIGNLPPVLPPGGVIG